MVCSVTYPGNKGRQIKKNTGGSGVNTNSEKLVANVLHCIDTPAAAESLHGCEGPCEGTGEKQDLFVRARRKDK